MIKYGNVLLATRKLKLNYFGIIKVFMDVMYKKYKILYCLKKLGNVFLYFVIECDPTKSEMVYLRNVNNGRTLNCFLSTLNSITYMCPSLFEAKAGTKEEGPDMTILSCDVHTYKTRKIVATVKRFKNKVSVCFQLMFDPEGTGNSCVFIDF